MATEAEKLVIVLEAQSLKLQRELVATNRLIDRFAAQTERRFDLMQKKNAASFEQLGRSVRTSMGGLQRAIAPVIGGLGLREVIGFGDEWISAGNKIAAAGQVVGLQVRSLNELKDSANGARTAFSEYVDLYSRLIRSSATIGATELEVAKATDLVAKSLKAGGASAQEQTASLIQLGQALGSGILQGDELRSIRENAPLVARAIAKEFGVTIGQLKELGAEGKLTSDRVFKALLNGADDIEAAFAKTQSTVKDAFSRVENEFIAYIGNADAAQGATAGLIDALNFLANNFTEIADEVVQFAAVLAGAFAGRAIVGGIGAATVALGAFLTALRAGTLGAATFTAALGPIGLLAGAAAAAIVLLNYSQGDAARAAEAHAEALAENQNKLDLARGASDEYRKALQRQIALQLQAAEAAVTEAEAQLEAAKTKALAAGIFDLAMQALGETFGMTSGGARPSQYEAGIMGPAEAGVAASRQRVADLRRQFAEIDAIRLTPPGTKDRAGDGKGAGAGKGKQNEYEKAIESIQKRTAALKAETAAQAAVNPLINDYGFAVENAKAKQDLLWAAQQAGLKITPELRAAIDTLANGYAAASVEAQKLAESQDQARANAEMLRDTAKDTFRGFIDDMIAGKSAADILANSLGKIGDKLLEIGLDTLFGGGSNKSDPFGVIGKLFLHKNGGIAAHGRPQPLKKYAGGGVSNSAAIFGEAGPEAAVPLPDGRRIPVDLRMPKGGAGGGVTVTFAPVIDATGADAAAISRLEAGLARMKAELPSQVVKAVRDAKSARALRG